MTFHNVLLNFCCIFVSREFSAVVDLTSGGFDDIAKVSSDNGFPYLRIEATNYQFVQVKKSTLQMSRFEILGQHFFNWKNS